MVRLLRYDSRMRASIAAVVAIVGLALVSPAAAQINGVPASVSSIGFGGNFGSAPGVPSSVTSIGPAGLVPGGNFVVPNNFSSHSFIHLNQVPAEFNHGLGDHHGDHHQHFGQNIAIYPVPYAVPYAVPVAVPSDEASDEEADQYNGGPTIFDRRGSGESYPQRPPVAEPAAQAAADATSEPSTAAADQPATLLIFKDGHQVEVQNYAIIGDTLYDMTPGHRRRVALSELDLSATAQQNEDRGIDFQVPTT